MKLNQIQELINRVECKSDVIAYATAVHGGGWSVNFNFGERLFSCVDLQTARGEKRVFKSLDAVHVLFKQLGINSFNVVG